MDKKHNTNQAATVPTPDCRIIEERKPTAPERQLANDCKPQGKMRTIFDRWNEMPPAIMPPPPDDVERAIAQGEIPRWKKLTDLLPQLEEHPPHKWYDVIFADDTCRAFRDKNPRLIMHLFNISEYSIVAAHETAWRCQGFKSDMPTADDNLRDTRKIELFPLSYFYTLPDIAVDYPKPRKDKGGKHTTRAKRTSQWDKTAKSVAADFNKSRFVPERGAKPMGGCTETQIKQWDLEYPDAEHPHPRWGYYADLRLRADLKSEYGEVLQNWARYWADYNVAFKEWRKAHPASRRESFRFRPMKKANGYNPEWIGQDENGTIYNAPTE